MIISHKERDITFEVNTEDKLCILSNSSGEGKTFLFRTLSEVTDAEWSNKYFYFDYGNMNTVRLCKEVFYIDTNVVVLDNADLYANDIIDILEKSKAYVIIIAKDIANFTKLNPKFYKVIHTPSRITFTRR